MRVSNAQCMCVIPDRRPPECEVALDGFLFTSGSRKPSFRGDNMTSARMRGGCQSRAASMLRADSEPFRTTRWSPLDFTQGTVKASRVVGRSSMTKMGTVWRSGHRLCYRDLVRETPSSTHHRAIQLASATAEVQPPTVLE